MTEIVPAHDPEAIPRATRALDAGALVVYPTDTAYALGADALDETAVARLMDAKGARDALPVLVATFEDARHVARVTPLARQLAARFLPGPLTLVLPAIGTVPENLLGSGETVAVRVPASSFARDLAAHFGPVVATSAGYAGKPPLATVAEARGALGSLVDLYVDGGPLPGRASTIIDATGDAPRLIREGALPAKEILS